MADRLIIVEDEQLLAREVERRYLRQGWQVYLAQDIAAARRLFVNAWVEPLVVIADLSLPDGNSLDLLEELKIKGIPVGEWVFLTAYGTIPDSVRALHLGAYEFLEKPYEEARLDLAVASAARSAQAQRILRDQAEEGSRRYGAERFVGSSPQAREVRQLLMQIAGVDFSALVVQGDTGTGKGLAARIIHYNSARASGPLVEVNCAAIPENMLESELFGHEAGAFTGARGRHRGLFEQAHGGTLFLDEIAELPLGLQAKLLKAVEEKNIRRVGGEREIRIDVRIIVATNRDLGQAVVDDRFRSDLYHRLTVFRIDLPTLAERADDIEELVWLLITEFNDRAHRRITRVPDSIWEALKRHPWSGNVRELSNVIERCVLLSKGDALEPCWMQLERVSERPDEHQYEGDRLCFAVDGTISMEQIEHRILEQALKRCDGNVTKAARLLGMSRQTMRYRVDKYRLYVTPGADGLEA